jgi:hypothetical protein
MLSLLPALLLALTLAIMFIRSPAIIFYPALLLWSLLFGSLAGGTFKLLAVYENWLAVNNYHLTLWKKYPQRSYNKYISSIWASQIRGVPLELAEYKRQQIEEEHHSEPFPFFRLLANTLFMLLITPYMFVVGFFTGPQYVFRKTIEKRTAAFANR